VAIGPDRVQVLKQESAALGGDGADDVPYLTPIEAQEDAIEAAGLYVQDALNRDENVYIARAGDDLQFRDNNNPDPVSLARALAAGLAGTEGPWLATLSGAYRETLPAADPFPTLITWWTDNTKTKKLMTKLLTLGTNKLPTAIQWSVYGPDGTTVIAQITDSITYSSVFETSRTRTVT